MSEGVFTAVIGIIGTLAGTILGWFLNNISRRGKIKAFVVEWDERCELNDTGRMVDSPSYEEAEYYSYSITLDIYNSSSDTKIMRDFRMEFLKAHKVVVADEPLNADDKGELFYRAMGVLNVPPKSIVPLHLCGGFWRSNFELFDEINVSSKVRLSYRDDKNVDKHIMVDVLKNETRFAKIERLRKKK